MSSALRHGVQAALGNDELVVRFFGMKDCDASSTGLKIAGNLTKGIQDLKLFIYLSYICQSMSLQLTNTFTQSIAAVIKVGPFQLAKGKLVNVDEAFNIKRSKVKVHGGFYNVHQVYPLPMHALYICITSYLLVVVNCVCVRCEQNIHKGCIERNGMDLVDWIVSRACM